MGIAKGKVKRATSESTGKRSDKSQNTDYDDHIGLRRKDRLAVGALRAVMLCETGRPPKIPASGAGARAHCDRLGATDGDQAHGRLAGLLQEP